MNIRNLAVTFTLAALTLPTSLSCVSTRPSRNGVFNENTYIRKDFLVAEDATGNDNGWFMKTTILQTSSPNPLAGLDFFTGAEAEGGAWVRFDVTQDQLRMINMRELSAGNPAQATRTPEVVDSWGVTNVDLKYRVNLDGERTNFYEENQELSWEVRQWVKLNLSNDGGGPFSAFGTFANDVLAACTDQAHTTATLVPDSFHMEQNGPDASDDYMSWKIAVSVPLVDSPECVEAFSQPTSAGNPWDTFTRLGRHNVEFVIMHSFTRAHPVDPTYTPLVIDEKDHIRRKYGTIDYITESRDPATGLLGARALTMRFNPTQPIVFYFAPGYPEQYKHFFTDPHGIVASTNDVLASSGATARLSVKNFDEDLAQGQAPREFGDVRYNFIRWEEDVDTDSPFIGVTQFVADPRNGELISSSINVAEFQFNDRVRLRLEAYLQSIGAVSPEDASGEWTDPGPCQDGDVIPIAPDTLTANHNGHSSLYRKMQEYLLRPVATYGNLGPQDFIYGHTDAAGHDDQEFWSTYFQLLPYQVYADPAMNPFVIPEGGSGTRGPSASEFFDALRNEAEFHRVTSQIDHGQVPYDTTGRDAYDNSLAFMHHFRDLQRSHERLGYLRNFTHGHAMFDADSMLSYPAAFQRNARHCVAGHWETKEEYLASMIDSYHALTVWHEFGHAMGLDHNFMASVDRPNFPHYQDATGRDHIGMYQSSVMEYNAAPDRTFWHSDTGGYGWGPYDRAALAFIYANNTRDMTDPSPSVSGQTSPTSPWHDPLGFTADGHETQYLYCNAQHMLYTPLCRQFDLGTTPSEIIANQIDDYEWNYQWRNFRLYRKLWDESFYADTPASMIYDMRRFISLWTYDWQSGEITDSMRRLGITPPSTAIAAAWYDQLNFKFESDISSANQMVAAFHKAVINQSTGERPYTTRYDPYFGDVTQQGIILDKLFALQSWTDLWPVENYDLNQSEGAYIASYSSTFGDASFETLTEDTVESMVGGQYDVFPFYRPLAVSLFASATHDVNYEGRTEMRDWTGGHVFYRLEDFLAYFRNLAVTYDGDGCTGTLESCDYDPRARRADDTDIAHSDDYNEFVGPDHRRYIWMYYDDRNTWIVADRDRNTATYVILRNYTATVVHGESDGTFEDGLDPYGALLPVKYFLDSYQEYN